MLAKIIFVRLVASDGLYFLNEHIIRSNAIQNIALDLTEHTMQSFLKCINVWMFPHVKEIFKPLTIEAMHPKKLLCRLKKG